MARSWPGTSRSKGDAVAACHSRPQVYFVCAAGLLVRTKQGASRKHSFRNTSQYQVGQPATTVCRHYDQIGSELLSRLDYRFRRIARPYHHLVWTASETVSGYPLELISCFALVIRKHTLIPGKVWLHYAPRNYVQKHNLGVIFQRKLLRQIQCLQTVLIVELDGAEYFVKHEGHFFDPLKLNLPRSKRVGTSRSWRRVSCARFPTTSPQPPCCHRCSLAHSR
jgi:hypothetical protein